MFKPRIINWAQRKRQPLTYAATIPSSLSELIHMVVCKSPHSSSYEGDSSLPSATAFFSETEFHGSYALRMKATSIVLTSKSERA